MERDYQLPQKAAGSVAGSVPGIPGARRLRGCSGMQQPPRDPRVGATCPDQRLPQGPRQGSDPKRAGLPPAGRGILGGGGSRGGTRAAWSQVPLPPRHGEREGEGGKGRRFVSSVTPAVPSPPAPVHPRLNPARSARQGMCRVGNPSRRPARR